MSNACINLEIEVPTRYLRMVGNVAEQIAKAADANNDDQETLAFHLNLILTEAVANAIQHGAPHGSKSTVRVCLSIENNELLARVYDYGAVPTLDFAETNERGRGSIGHIDEFGVFVYKWPRRGTDKFSKSRT